jgi:hypothetical protein
MAEHCCDPKLPLRPPIRRSGPALARGTLPAQEALAHSLACSPNAGVAGVVRADTGNVLVVMRDVPVPVEDAVGNEADTRSAEASRIHAWRVYCSDSIHSQHLQVAGRAQWDLC